MRGIEVVPPGALVTVTDAEPVMPSNVALMVAGPAAAPVANPGWTAPVVCTLAEFVDEDQPADVVASCVVPLEKCMTASNCCVPLTASVRLVGLRVIEDPVLPPVTVSWVDPVTPEDVAAIVTVPAAMPEARPGSAPPVVWM